MELEASDFVRQSQAHLCGLSVEAFLAECIPPAADIITGVVAEEDRDAITIAALIDTLVSCDRAVEAIYLAGCAQQWYYATVVCGSQRIVN